MGAFELALLGIFSSRLLDKFSWNVQDVSSWGYVYMSEGDADSGAWGRVAFLGHSMGAQK